MASYHAPVMVEQVVASLRCQGKGIYVDGTIGGGGHAEAILRSTAPDGLVIGIDADDEALREAERRLAPFGLRKILVKGNFADMEAILAERNIERVDGILLDLGVSSHQLDAADRGFSFSLDAPLDMRMDRRRKNSAYDLIHTLAEKEIERILREYGEERRSGRIARAIVAQRNRSPLRTTAELASLVCRAMGPRLARQRIHPATRTFQALRIAVNDELGSLQRAMASGTELLTRGGRFCAISFHSLEDRIVKEAFNAGAKGCVCPPDLPCCVCGRKPTLKVIARKPVTADEEELRDNPRSRSAKLRTAERI
jgi:16S rRNA (cytosine1402-N4)-methyltransferase